MEISESPKVVHWKREAYDIYVGRPSPYGNPFSHKSWAIAKFRTKTAAESLLKYKEWVLAQPALIVKIKRELRGKILGCWCSNPEHCHGWILLKIANDWPFEDAPTLTPERVLF